MGNFEGLRGKLQIGKLEALRAESVVLDRKLMYQERTAAFISGSWNPYGNMGATLTTGGKSPNGLENAGMSRIFDHRALRANTRDAMYDSIHGRAIVTRFADTIAGEGLRAYFEPISEVLGRTPEEVELWGRDVSHKYHLFLNSKEYSTDGSLTGYQAQWQYAFSQQRDNDFYARVHYERGGDRISPLSIQHLDADQLCGYAYTASEGTTNLVDKGITYDGKGREKDFTFMVKGQDGSVAERTIPKFGPRSKKQYIIHAFRPEYAGQRKGYSLYAHALQRLEDLTTLGGTYISKAIIEASIGGWTKPSKDAPASGFMEDAAKESVDVVADMLAGVDISEKAKQEIQTSAIRTFPELSLRTPSVWVGTAGAGEGVEPFKGVTPSEAFSGYVDNVVEYLSASSGMSIEFLKMKFGENYSASRATLVLVWRIVIMWRAEMEADYLNVVATIWLSEEIAAGRIQAPGWEDPRLRAAWTNIRWVGSSMPVIDPKKESEANKNNVTLGATTLDNIALAHNRSDGRKNRATLRRELAELPTPPWDGNNSGDGGEDDEDLDDGTGVAPGVSDKQSKD